MKRIAASFYAALAGAAPPSGTAPAPEASAS